MPPESSKTTARLLSQSLKDFRALLSRPRMGVFEPEERSQHMTWNPERRPNNTREEEACLGMASTQNSGSGEELCRHEGRSRAEKEGVHKKLTPERRHDAVTVTQCHARLFARCFARRIFMTPRSRYKFTVR